MARAKDKPRWIWLAAACHRENVYLRARRLFVLAAKPVEARLQVTALARYVLYVNGEYVGCGPGPSSAEAPLLDEYAADVLPLKRGANVIAVLAHNPYVGTPRRPRTPGGLWLRLQATYKNGRTETLVTDGAWTLAPADDFSVRAPRIYWTAGFCEIRDTRREPDGRARRPCLARVRGPCRSRPSGSSNLTAWSAPAGRSGARVRRPSRSSSPCRIRRMASFTRPRSSTPTASRRPGSCSTATSPAPCTSTTGWPSGRGTTSGSSTGWSSSSTTSTRACITGRGTGPRWPTCRSARGGTRSAWSSTTLAGRGGSPSASRTPAPARCCRWRTRRTWRWTTRSTGRSSSTSCALAARVGCRRSSRPMPGRFPTRPRSWRGSIGPATAAIRPARPP